MDYNLYKDAFNAIPECKYRLPCGWCDRNNELCVIYQSYKVRYDPDNDVVSKDESLNKDECDHHWVYTGSVDGSNCYQCSKCGMGRIMSSSSGGAGNLVI